MGKPTLSERLKHFRIDKWLMDEFIRDAEELEAKNEQLYQDRYDALSVTSKDGLLSSEWILRTGQAERKAKELEVKLEVDKITMDNFLKRITKMEIAKESLIQDAKDQSDRLTHKIAELEARVADETDVFWKDKYRLQIAITDELSGKHTALRDEVREYATNLESTGDFDMSHIAEDLLALLDKEKQDG